MGQLSASGESGRGPLVWLASYPKSGNTWMRVFLENLLRESPDPVSINDLTATDHAASRARFEELAGVESGDLSPAEIERLRPAVYAGLAGVSTPQFIKIHDAARGPRSGELLVPMEATRGVIYMIRNPLDVAASYAHHRGTDVDEVIGVMSDPTHTLSGHGGTVHIQLPQCVGTWSGHVKSWVDESGLDVHVVRYEDLQSDPVDAFAAAAAFAGLSTESATLERALAFSRFEELRRQEEEVGFTEGSQEAETFFRRGEAGAWKDELTTGQIRRLVADHGDVMRRFGYLDEQGAVVE